MLKRIDSHLSNITPERASELLRYVNPDRQRALTPSHRAKLATLMSRHDYLTGHIVIAILPNGTKCIANGQHSLAAVVESGLEQYFLVETYRCDTDDDYARLFMAFDTEERRRTWTESASAFKMAYRSDISPTMLNYFRAGVEYLGVVMNDRSAEKTRYARFSAVDMGSPIVALFCELMHTAIDERLVRRSSQISAIIVTANIDIDAARVFWTEVFTGRWPMTNVHPHYPPYRLHNYIREVSVFTGGGGTRALGTRSKHATQFDLYCASITCWNAWGRGDNVVQLRGAYNGKAPTPERPSKELLMALSM